MRHDAVARHHRNLVFSSLGMELPSAKYVTALVADQPARICEDTSKNLQRADHKQKTVQTVALALSLE